MSKFWTMNFKTLKRDLSFWILVGCLVIFCSVTVDNMAYWAKDIMFQDYFCDTQLFEWCFLFPGLAVTFSAFYIGKGYRHNTIRNRILRGIKRENIYFSNLLTVFLVCLAFVLVYMLVIYVSARILKLDFYYSYDAVLIRLALSLFPMFSFCCLCTAISMNIKNEIGSLILGMAIMGAMLWLPDGSDFGYAYTNVFEKEFLEFMNAFLPMQQFFSITDNFAVSDGYDQFNSMIKFSEIDALLIPYALLSSAISTVAGLLLFKKKNIN